MTYVPLWSLVIASTVGFLIGVVLTLHAVHTAIDDWEAEREPFTPQHDPYVTSLLERLRR